MRGNRASRSKNFSSSANPSRVAPDLFANQLPIPVDQRPGGNQLLGLPLASHPRNPRERSRAPQPFAEHRCRWRRANPPPGSGLITRRRRPQVRRDGPQAPSARRRTSSSICMPPACQGQRRDPAVSSHEPRGLAMSLPLALRKAEATATLRLGTATQGGGRPVKTLRPRAAGDRRHRSRYRHSCFGALAGA